MKKYIAIVAMFCIATIQSYGFQPTVPTESEAEELMEGEVGYMASMRAGTQLSGGYWELRSASGIHSDTADHDWPAFGISETVTITHDRTAEITIAAGNDSVMHPVLKDHNAVLVHLSATNGFPYNTLTVTDIRINDVSLAEFAPLEVETAVKYHDYLLITDLPRIGVGADDYVIEMDIIFDSLLGVRAGGDDLRIDVCGVTVEEELPIDPTTIDYDTPVNPYTVNGRITPAGPGSGAPNDRIVFTWTGEVGRYYVVKVSSDLVTWETVPDLYFLGDESSPLEYVDHDFRLHKRRFYALFTGDPYD